MSSEAVSCLLNQESAFTKKQEVPVEHLDYGYIEKCVDLKYLEKILKVLRSGKEGIYPHLIEFCEKHIEKLDPKSRTLRKQNAPATAASFSKDEWKQITDDIQMWETDIKVNEIDLRQPPLFSNSGNIPPVRGYNFSVQKASNARIQNNSKRSPLPQTYKDWDKFDVEKECAKIDESVTKNSFPAIVNHSLPNIKRIIDTTALTRQEKAVLAHREKDKGNDAFRASDYEEAVAFYTRSVSFLPTAAAYNNRAQAEIKLQRWHDAMSDCERVLHLEPENTKALLRRATVHKHLGNLLMAHDDLTVVMHLEPHNVTAQSLLRDVSKNIKVDMQDKPSKSTKLLIQEVEEEEYDEDEREIPDNDQTVVQEAVRGDMGWDRQKVQAEGVTETVKEEGLTSDTTAQQDGSNMTVPAWATAERNCVPGALPPVVAQLKSEGNQLFKIGQFVAALEKYTQAIKKFTEAGLSSPEDLCILYSNRAACYLKGGSSSDCIADCNRALELQPLNVKVLLRRAMAYECLEYYHKAYMDYRNALQINSRIPVAHNSINRITRFLAEMDGPDWRQKLPVIPLLSRRQAPPSAQLVTCTQGQTQEAARTAKESFTSMKKEGDELMKNGHYQEATVKYSKCLQIQADECAVYTSRALCFIKLERFAEAKQDCDSAIKLERSNKKAFYRRALAHRGLKDYVAYILDLQEVLHLNASVQGTECELAEVTVLQAEVMAMLREQHDIGFPIKPRKSVVITEVEWEDDEREATESSWEAGQRSSGQYMNLQPSSVYEFGQVLNAACSHKDTAACAQLLCSITPAKLPKYISTHLDAHTLSFIFQALDLFLLSSEPNLVYQILSHLHTTERFSVVLMLLDSDEKRQMIELFKHMCSVESELFSQSDIQSLENKYICMKQY
ncbi:sperm-associated antigen 1-like [Electrophorus electricus]|uniref:sperm-associated antigen 1-like n=1 Tax=Electrophorus electricus TaxID=8005 RepID=UPI0015D0ACFC|nr:sperm-associated antigen 1-like [Electrophorus electricus]